MKISPAVASLAGLILFCAAAARADPPVGSIGGSAARPAAPTLDLSAQGESRVAPDMASLTLGVQTKAGTAAAALGANAGRMARVLAALKRAAIPDRDIATASITLAPQYAYDQNQPPRLTGYQAGDEVVVRVETLSALGPVIDAAVGAGATDVGGVSFGLANPVAAENSARVAAVKALQDKAALYAELTGYRIARLVNLTEGAAAPNPPRPLAMMAMARAAPSTPTEPGEMTVRVEITGVFELTR
ncbi:MAG: SIMPL domain-containing protein [Caulobacteraceae bacterium]